MTARAQFARRQLRIANIVKKQRLNGIDIRLT